jgi:1-acyl-sn-glycerol-3-phosphate acyltransferase
MFYWFIKGLAWPLVTVYLRFRRRGVERVPRRGPCILVANHSSYLDAICLGSASPRKVRFLISDEIYRMWRLRWFYYMMDAIPLRTGGSDAAALRRAMDVLRSGGVVGIFPEGQRMRDGRLGEGKMGVAFLAARSGAPVVPTAILGAHAAMPVGAAFPRPRPVRVVFGSPLAFSAGGAARRKEALAGFANLVMESIAALAEGQGGPGRGALGGALGERGV